MDSVVAICVDVLRVLQAGLVANVGDGRKAPWNQPIFRLYYVINPICAALQERVFEVSSSLHRTTKPTHVCTGIGAITMRLSLPAAVVVVLSFLFDAVLNLGAPITMIGSGRRRKFVQLEH